MFCCCSRTKCVGTLLQNLPVHNFPVCNLGSKRCIWNECEGVFKGNEFATCVGDFLSLELSTIEDVQYFYGCGYQNRNLTTSYVFSFLSLTYEETNTPKNPQERIKADSVHNTFERKIEKIAQSTALQITCLS